MTRETIEPVGDSFAVYRHDTYPWGSVLAGKARRVFLGGFPTSEEAQGEHADAEVLDHSTKEHHDPDQSLADLSGLPSTPPDWFDPADAGERWDDDY